MASGEVFLSTERVEPALRDEYWRQVTRPIVDTTPIAGHGDARLAGTLASRMLGELLMWRTSFNAQQYRRDRRTIQQSGFDQYVVQLVRSGSLVGDFNGVEVRACPGDIYIIDLGQPLCSRVDAGESVAVFVPREGLEKASGGRDLHGVVLHANRAITRLLADYLVGMYELGEQASPAQAIAVQDAMVALLAAALAEAAAPAGRRPVTHGAALRRRIVQHISQHVTDRDLSPDTLMTHFRISRAHLYRVFEADGGVARFIRDRRLDLAYRALVDPRSNGQTIKEVAFRYGFSSSDMLVRAMRQRFGATAREIRTEHGEHFEAAHDLSSLHVHFARHAVPVIPLQGSRD
ncbi:helix-turn-helix domain-containing protein [Burkholderia sp. F1]|uniref:helix-turn-helix domain-containing protein n=1 Tax=Burkholderia sp. F1 TaxID=3366817 RepID=UPI003D748B81